MSDQSAKEDLILFFMNIAQAGYSSDIHQSVHLVLPVAQLGNHVRSAGDNARITLMFVQHLQGLGQTLRQEIFLDPDVF